MDVPPKSTQIAQATAMTGILLLYPFRNAVNKRSLESDNSTDRSAVAIAGENENCADPTPKMLPIFDSSLVIIK